MLLNGTFNSTFAQKRHPSDRYFVYCEIDDIPLLFDSAYVISFSDYSIGISGIVLDSTLNGIYLSISHEKQRLRPDVYTSTSGVSEVNLSFNSRRSSTTISSDTSINPRLQRSYCKVTITELTSTHVAGTFEAKQIPSHSPGQMKEIKNGSFRAKRYIENTDAPDALAKTLRDLREQKQKSVLQSKKIERVQDHSGVGHYTISFKLNDVVQRFDGIPSAEVKDPVDGIYSVLMVATRQPGSGTFAIAVYDGEPIIEERQYRKQQNGEMQDVILSYMDADGEVWNSLGATGPSVIQFDAITDDYLKGTFSGTLQSTARPEREIRIGDGEFYGIRINRKAVSEKP